MKEVNSAKLTNNMFQCFTALNVDVKADFQSVVLSEQAEILLFAEENVALKLKR